MEWLAASIEKVIEVPLDVAVGYWFCTFAGVLVNWIWTCKKDGIKLSTYWLDDVKGTVGVFAGAFAAFLTAVIIEPGLGKATYFAIGIAADSMIGRPPMPIAVRTALERLKQSDENANDPVIVDAHGVGMSNQPAVDSPAAVAVAEIGQAYTSGNTPAKTDSNPGAS